MHPADDVRIFDKECRTLAASGFDVAIVAPGAGASRDGVRFISVPRPRTRAHRMTRTAAEVFRAAVRRRARVYHLHDPELIPAGILLRLTGARVVYDVHEDLPRQILGKPWIAAAVRHPVALAAAAAERVAAAMFDAIVTVTPTIAARFPAGKTTLVRNYPRPADFAPPAVARPYADRPRRIVYVGAIDGSRGACQMVRAIGRVDHSDATLALAGRVRDPRLAVGLAAEPGWDRVESLGWLDRDGVGQLLAASRIGIVTLLPTPSYVAAYPIKLFEYMAAGLPVIASDFPVWRAIVDGAQCGLLVDPSDPAAIAAAITRLLDNPGEAEAMGRRGREAAESRFSWKSEGDALVALYRRLGADA